MYPKAVILTLYNKEAYILRQMQLLKKIPSSHYSNELIKIGRILEASLLGNLSNSNDFSAVLPFCVQRVAILLGYPVKQTQTNQPENVQMLSSPVHPHPVRKGMCHS